MAISDSGLLYLGDYFKCQLAHFPSGKSGRQPDADRKMCEPGILYSSHPLEKQYLYRDNAGCVGAVAVSPDGSHIYVSRWSSYKFSIIDASTCHLDREVTMPGKSSAGVAVSPDSRRVYVSDHDSGLILVYDAAGNYIDRIPMKTDIRELEISGDGRHLVVNHEDGSLSLS